jgi:penicillin-binding protein 2
VGIGFLPGHTRQAGMRQQPAWLLALVVLVAVAMGVRLAWLQLLHGQENRLLADQNRIRLVPRHPMRGRLLDRNGQVLATNRLTYNLYVQPRLVSEARSPP